MLYRKSELKKHKYFLKSIHVLWILPIVIINLIVPLFNFFIYKLNNNDMVIDIEKIIFFFSILFLFPQDMTGGCLLCLYLYQSNARNGAGEVGLLFRDFLANMHKNSRWVGLCLR